jgi:hypothetical protein
MHSVKYTSEYCESYAMQRAEIILTQHFLSFEALGWTMIRLFAPLSLPVALGSISFRMDIFTDMGTNIYLV